MTNETNVTAPVNVTGALVTNTVANHAEKAEKCNGQNFKSPILRQKEKEKRRMTRREKRKVEYIAPKAVIVKQKFQGLATTMTSQVTVLLIVRCQSRAVNNGEKLYMGNSATADIKGERDVILKMTSEKELKLTNVLSRYTSNPSDAQWKSMTSDANWISDIKDSRSTSGYVFTLGGAAISCKSSKQTVIDKSTMESEFIALDKCGEEADWLWVISIDYVKSNDNITNLLTKGLSKELVSKSSKGIEGMSFYEGKTNPVEWRSQDLGLI
nr:acetylglutamate kinase, chloroplastic [Tanacetum cinerariifolium]